MKMSRSIESCLTSLSRRQRKLEVMSASLRGLCYGGWLAVLVATSLWLSGASLRDGAIWFAVAWLPVGAIIGGCFGVMRKLDNLRLARALDKAAGSDDQFASAVQLANHPRRERVQRIAERALHKVLEKGPRDALKWQTPSALKWLPIAAVALGTVFWFDWRQPAVSHDIETADVSAIQWNALESQLREDIDRRFHDPDDPLREELANELKDLASSLSEHPEKKDVLSAVANMRAQLEQRRQQLSTGDLNMRNAAAEAFQESELLERLAELLKQGDYLEAAQRLDALATEIESGNVKPSAEELEKAGRDLDRLANQLEDLDKLGRATGEAADAARELDPEELARALKEMAELMEEIADDLEESDAIDDADRTLEDFERELGDSDRGEPCPVCQGQGGDCEACKGGQKRFVRGGRPGGSRAGRGTANQWANGGLGDQENDNVPNVVPDQERSGRSATVASTVSTDERADSAQAYREKFAEFVQKSEADLDLENVPHAYRRFLTAYFDSIKPTDESAPEQP